MRLSAFKNVACAVAFAAGALAPGQVLAAEEPDKQLQLHLEANALRVVKVAVFDTASGRYKSSSPEVSDMWLRVSVRDGTAKEAIQQQNAANIDRGLKLFSIELISVVGGKLYSDTLGDCSGWSQDVAWCTYGCDGQGFQLKRLSSEYPIKLRIALSATVPKHGAAEGMPARRPLAITLCGADANGHELLIVPRTGESAEIKFSNE